MAAPTSGTEAPGGGPGRWGVRACMLAAALAAVSAVVVVQRVVFVLKASSTPLVRRPSTSVAELSAADLNLTAAVLWTMRTTSTWSGRLRYGRAFANYGDFVRAHADDVDSLRCGEASIHGHGALFFAFHRLFGREFAAAFDAVAGGAVGVPAWRPRSGAGATSLDDAPFLGDWVGDADRGFAVGRGAFADWPVPWRAAPSVRAAVALPPVLVRYGEFCGEPAAQYVGSARRGFGELQRAGTWGEMAQHAILAHNHIHRGIGGAVECNGTRRTPGDFENGRASANDPVFFMVHAAFDAALDDWLRAGDAPPPGSDRADVAAAAAGLVRELEPCRESLGAHRFAATLFDEGRLRRLLLEAVDSRDAA